MAMSSKQKLYMGAGVSLMALLALLGFGGEAKADDTVPEPKPKDDDDPQDVLDEIYSDSPVPGKLYLIKQGDNLSNISIRAMQAAIPGGLDQKLIPRYQKCVSASAWNRELYGLGGDFTEGFPKWTSPDNISIRSAFFPDHDNAISAILNKQMPDRGNFIRSGNGYSGGAGSSYGLLWLPPVNKETLAEHQEPQCALQKWPDGTSAMEPPAVLFKLFGGA